MAHFLQHCGCGGRRIDAPASMWKPGEPGKAGKPAREQQVTDTKTALKITSESFDQVTAKGVSVVDFWAEWCMPCRMQGPIVEQVARKMGDRVAVCKLNVDEHPGPAERYGVTGIPTLIFFKDGTEAGRLVGVQNEAAIVRTLESLLS